MKALCNLVGLSLALALAACDGKDDEAGRKGDADPPAARAPADPTPAPAPAPVADGNGSGARPKPVAPAPTPPKGGEEGGTGDDPAAKPPPTAPGSPAKGTPRPVAPMPEGIVQVSATKWTISSALVERWKNSPRQVSNVRESGEGWALVGVRQRAAYHLGMRNGDVIIEANGHKLDTKTQLLAAYLDLKNDTEFTVVFLRDGQRMVHHYEIVP